MGMKAKTKLGMGMRTRKRKTRKRLLPVAKRGGFLPLLPILGALGSLVGGTAGVTKVINDSKAAQRQLEELRRHNRTLEGRGLYLAPYKRGTSTMIKKKERKKKNVVKRNARSSSVRCHDERTVESLGTSLKHTILQRCVYA